MTCNAISCYEENKENFTHQSSFRERRFLRVLANGFVAAADTEAVPLDVALCPPLDSGAL